MPCQGPWSLPATDNFRLSNFGNRESCRNSKHRLHGAIGGRSAGLLSRSSLPSVSGPNQGRRLIDGVVILNGPHLIANLGEAAIENREIVVIQTKAYRLGMYLLGQALFSRHLMMAFRPRSVNTVAICTKGDAVLEPFGHGIWNKGGGVSGLIQQACSSRTGLVNPSFNVLLIGARGTIGSGLRDLSAPERGLLRRLVPPGGRCPHGPCLLPEPLRRPPAQGRTLLCDPVASAVQFVNLPLRRAVGSADLRRKWIAYGCTITNCRGAGSLAKTGLGVVVRR